MKKDRPKKTAQGKRCFYTGAKTASLEISKLLKIILSLEDTSKTYDAATNPAGIKKCSCKVPVVSDCQILSGNRRSTQSRVSFAAGNAIARANDRAQF